MHILFYIHYYAPNGGERAEVSQLLAQALAARGHRVTVLTTVPHYPQGKIPAEYQGRWVYESVENGVHVIRLWVWATPSARISRKLINQVSFMVMSLLRGLDLPRADAAYMESQPFFTGIAARLYCGLRGIPFVQNVSDLWPDHLLSVGAMTATSPIYRWARWTMDRGFRASAALTSMSPAWARQMVIYTGGQREKIFTILRGADLTRFHPEVDSQAFRARAGLDARKIVSFIGTFAMQYDFELQMRVVARLAQRGDVQCVFIGTGTQRDQVEALAATVPSLHLISWVDSAEMPAAWNISTVNFWALRPEPLYEGTIPAKLFEAFASGIPVVCALAGETSAILHASGGGIAVPTNDEDALVRAIEQVLDDDALRDRMARAARAWAVAHFDMQAALAEYVQLIENAAR